MTCADCSNSSGGGLLLAINGADERLQLVLGRAEAQETTLLAAQEWTVPGQSVRFLAPGIQALLDGLDLTAAQVGRIACVTGPGSFTGLRMSLAVAQGMAAGTGALVAGVNHLELLAHDAAVLSGRAVLALSWSRRAQVYAQAFLAAGDDQTASSERPPLALCPPLALRLDELPALADSLPRPLTLLGGGLRRNLPFFEDWAATASGITLLPAHFDTPRPETLLQLAARAEFRPATQIEPVYLRASDAEDNLQAIAAGRGLSLEQAREILARGSRTLE